MSWLRARRNVSCGIGVSFSLRRSFDRYLLPSMANEVECFLFSSVDLDSEDDPPRFFLLLPSLSPPWLTSSTIRSQSSLCLIPTLLYLSSQSFGLKLYLFRLHQLSFFHRTVFFFPGGFSGLWAFDYEYLVLLFKVLFYPHQSHYCSGFCSSGWTLWRTLRFLWSFSA